MKIKELTLDEKDYIIRALTEDLDICDRYKSIDFEGVYELLEKIKTNKVYIQSGIGNFCEAINVTQEEFTLIKGCLISKKEILNATPLKTKILTNKINKIDNLLSKMI